jgi:hypothetical protein
MDEFDPDFPCAYCEQPVQSLSVGGSAVCPWCDMGMNRDGSLWTYDVMKKRFANYADRLAASKACHALMASKRS